MTLTEPLAMGSLEQQVMPDAGHTSDERLPESGGDSPGSMDDESYEEALAKYYADLAEYEQVLLPAYLAAIDEDGNGDEGEEERDEILYQGCPRNLKTSARAASPPSGEEQIPPRSWRRGSWGEAGTSSSNATRSGAGSDSRPSLMDIEKETRPHFSSIWSGICLAAAICVFLGVQIIILSLAATSVAASALGALFIMPGPPPPPLSSVPPHPPQPPLLPIVIIHPPPSPLSPASPLSPTPPWPSPPPLSPCPPLPPPVPLSPPQPPLPLYAPKPPPSDSFLGTGGLLIIVAVLLAFLCALLSIGTILDACCGQACQAFGVVGQLLDAQCRKLGQCVAIAARPLGVARVGSQFQERMPDWKGDVKQQLVATAALDVESRRDLDEGSFKAAGKASCSRSDAVAAHAHRMHTVDLPPTMDQLGLTLTHHACTTSADGILLL